MKRKTFMKRIAMLAMFVLVAGLTVFMSRSNAADAATKVKAPKIKVTLNSKGQPVITWTKISGATGYRVYRKTSTDTGYVKVKLTTGAKVTDTKLSAAEGSTVTYVARSYVKINGKRHWSARSKAVKIQLPKKTETTPTATPTPQPTAEPTPQPTPVVTPEPTPEPTPVPVYDPEPVTPYDEDEITAQLLALMSEYPEGMSWTNDNYYYWSAIRTNCYGCIAFAGELSDRVFGKDAPVYKHTNLDSIRPGDHIRIGGYHSVIVLTADKDRVTVAEGNYNYSVHWGRVITKDSLASSGYYIETRYPSGQAR